jgi:tetratricopeptide (TPR) repeat protein
LVISRDAIGLAEDAPLWVDVVTFRCLVGEGDSTALQQAIDLYQADFMNGFSLPDSPDFDRWQYHEANLLRDELIAALRQLVEHHRAEGRLSEALLLARRWLTTDPLDAVINHLMMTLYIETGQREAAIRHYQEYTTLLNAELGVEPASEVQQLYESLTAGLPPVHDSPPPQSLLPRLPNLVVGRDAALMDLKRLLGLQSEDVPRSTLVIQGWPGLGKTTIAAVLAHEPDVAAAFPDGILWASLGEHPTLFSVVEQWSYALGVELPPDMRSLDEALHRLSALLSNKQMLLIVDDVWDLRHGAQLNVGGEACSMLVTTRMNDVAQGIAQQPEDIYRLRNLTQEDGVTLLKTLAPQAVAKYPQETAALTQDLEGLPLALQVAGRLLQAESQMGWGVADLLHELREGTRLLDAEVPADIHAVMDETSPTVAVLLKKSTNRLPPDIRQHFAVLGVFAPKPATFEIDAMQAVWETPNPKPIIRELVNRGLLEPLGDGQFQMHALLVAHARAMFS